VLASAFNQFNANATALAGALAKFPSRLEVENRGRVEVILNGAEVLGRLTDGLQEYVTAQVGKALKQAFKEKLPDAA
jgi:hypothetical protein